MKKNCLVEKKEEPNPDHLSSNHHEEVWSVGHLPQQPYLYEKEK
jgi:hypothetical protein